MPFWDYFIPEFKDELNRIHECVAKNGQRDTDDLVVELIKKIYTLFRNQGI
jgi:hypothetical protein